MSPSGKGLHLFHFLRAKRPSVASYDNLRVWYLQALCFFAGLLVKDSKEYLCASFMIVDGKYQCAKAMLRIEECIPALCALVCPCCKDCELLCKYLLL